LFNFHASVFCCIPAIIVTVSQAAREKGGGGRCRKGEARDGNTERWLEKECARECAK
jgi:hypothetical protein